MHSLALGDLDALGLWLLLGGAWNLQVGVVSAQCGEYSCRKACS